MRHLNRTSIIATIFILVVTAVVGPLAMQKASASPTNPLLYPYNQPSGITFNIADVTNAWTAYKNARVTTNGAQGGVRVLWDDGASTVSEGMGYGMLFEVIFDEQSNFDGMWRYVAQHLDANGLMNWKIDSGGATTGTGAATDGDEDMALALVNACVKVQKGAWPASPSGYNYCTLATNMINAIYNTEVDKAGSAPSGGLPNNPGGELLPGDTWTTASQYPNGIVNLSYFSPGYYTVFGKFTNNTSGWDAVNARNYAITNLAQAQGGNCSKLVPNWATYNGAAQLVSWQTNEYGWWSWDAARFAWRVAVDKAWYNNANSQETMNEVGGFFSSVGMANVKAQYHLDGTSVDTYDSAFFNANAAAAIWAAPAPIAVNCGAATATLKSTPQQGYDKLLSINDATSYYSSAWRLFGLLLITGNFPNIYELGNGTQISTSTPTRTNTPTVATNTPTRTSTVGTPVITNTPTRTATPTGACVTATPTTMSVAPVTSPTSATTQVIAVSVGSSTATVTITSEAGSFVQTVSSGGVYNVTINLVPNSTNHLTVQAVVNFGAGCSYTLTRTTDSNGNPLTIVQSSGGVTNTPTPTITRTPTSACIAPTQIAFSVAPVTSPTSATTQTITVTISLSNAASATVISEAGSFTQTGPSTVFNIPINLVPNSTNHLQVQIVNNYAPGCSYTLSKTTDSNGNPLNIVQSSGGVTPTLTRTPTATIPVTPPTFTPTPPNSVCTPVTSTVTIPFTFDGAGVFCWQASSLGGFINSWNTTNVNVNGVNVTNVWVGAGSLPAKVGGFYYVGYNSSVAWGHFEAKP